MSVSLINTKELGQALGGESSVKGISQETIEASQSEAAYVEQQKFKEILLELQGAKVAQFKSEHKMREWLTNVLLTVTVMWMLLILLIIVAVGKGSLKLSDTVLVTLITTTTANVAGFLYIVVKYLFNFDPDAKKL